MMFRTLVLSLALLASPLTHAAPPTDPTPAPAVDLKKYMGTWFSIASIPIAESKDCASGMKAEYTEDVAPLIKVSNSCLKTDGTTINAEGRARMKDANTTSQLQVTFARQGEVWNFDNAADYWILEVAPDYSWALVGGPGFKTGWILARAPALAPATLNMLNEKLLDQGYDTCRFMIDPQAGGLLDRKPLCQTAAPLPDVVDTLKADGRFNALSGAIGIAQLTDDLRAAGPITVFAPTDEAFAKLDPALLQRLLADPAALKKVLTFHVAQGDLSAAELMTTPSVPSVQGQALNFTVDNGQLMVNGVKVVVTDIPAKNGVIHAIDTVLMPQ